MRTAEDYDRQCAGASDAARRLADGDKIPLRITNEFWRAGASDAARRLAGGEIDELRGQLGRAGASDAGRRLAELPQGPSENRTEVQEPLMPQGV